MTTSVCTTTRNYATSSPYLEVLRRSVEQSRLRPTTRYYEDVSDAIQELVTEALTNPRRADHMVTTLAQRLAAVSQGR